MRGIVSGRVVPEHASIYAHAVGESDGAMAAARSVLTDGGRIEAAALADVNGAGLADPQGPADAKAGLADSGVAVTSLVAGAPHLRQNTASASGILPQPHWALTASLLFVIKAWL